MNNCAYKCVVLCWGCASVLCAVLCVVLCAAYIFVFVSVCIYMFAGVLFSMCVSCICVLCAYVCEVFGWGCSTQSDTPHSGCLCGYRVRIIKAKKTQA